MPDRRFRPRLIGLGWALATLAFGVGAIALVRDTRYQGQDFEVFWRAGLRLIEGQPLYDHARPDGMVFKYPPWIAPVFIPLALMPLDWAKWAWGVLNLLCLFFVIRWVLARSERGAWVAIAAAVFWGVWAVHALDGQVTLGVLALTLWAWDRPRRLGFAVGLAPLALSTKIFTLTGMLGAGREMRRWKVWGSAAALAIALSFPAVWHQPRHSFFDLAREWKLAAVSGDTALGLSKVRGRDNQGLPAAWTRLAPGQDLYVAMGILWVILGTAWALASRRLDRSSRAAGWLGLAVVLHPLAWFHSFVLAFPASALALERSFRSRRWTPRILSICGLLLVGVVTRRTLPGIGEEVERFSGKSLGVLLSLAALALIRDVRDAARP